MISASDLSVFDKYSDAGQHAFSNNVVSDADKDTYQKIYSELVSSADGALDLDGYRDHFESWSVRFGRDGGVQGHRPIDLWASVVNRRENSFGRFPQVYAIASSSGIEIGFTVAIHESDYYNLSVKEKNREIIPMLYRKLPPVGSDVTDTISASLFADAAWIYGLKSRQGLRGNFRNFAELVNFLKSPDASDAGGGSVFRIIGPDAIGSPLFDLKQAFKETLGLFAPLMVALSPSAPERFRLKEIEVLHTTSGEVPEFAPLNEEDGRKKILQAVAVRQGQSKFRSQLLEAYKGRCAITGTKVPSVLQAAHILPYNGPDTNHVANGILLRADIHNLFDLGLLHISPDNYRVSVAEELGSSPYKKLERKKIRLPDSRAKWPRAEYLRSRLMMFEG